MKSKKKKKKNDNKKLYILNSKFKKTNLIVNKSINFLKTNRKLVKLDESFEPNLICDPSNIVPFWNDHSKNLSKKLWHIPIKQFNGSDNNLTKCQYINIDVPNTQINIVKNINVPNITPYIEPKFNIIPNNEQYTKVSRRISVFPNKELKSYFSKCFGTYRYFFNQGVSYIHEQNEKRKKDIEEQIKKKLCCHIENNEFCKEKIHLKFETIKNDKGKLDIIVEEYKFCIFHTKCKIKYYPTFKLTDLRTKLIPNEFNENNMWQKEIPYDLKQNALIDMKSAIKSGISNKVNNGRKYNLKFKSKKNKSQIFKIPNRFIDLEKKKIMKSNKFCKNGSFRISRRSEKWLQSINYNINDNITIQKEYNKYYMYFTFDTKITNNIKLYSSVSIDPNVRVFASIYSPDGIVGDIGKDMDQKLYDLALKYDKLYSLRFQKKEGDNKAFKFKYRTRRNMRNRCHKIITKIQGVTNDLHKKTINLLCANFETIIIPKFEGSKKVKKKGRQINCKSVRKMLSLSHGKFLEKLEQSCIKSSNRLIKVSEEYTSKTCGNCGNVKKDLGGNKTYNCLLCGYNIDRDTNGARNIMLRVLTKLVSTK